MSAFLKKVGAGVHFLHDMAQKRGLIESDLTHLSENNFELGDTLVRDAGKLGLTVQLVDPVLLDGAAVSSSRIRTALRQAQTEEAVLAVLSPDKTVDAA